MSPRHVPLPAILSSLAFSSEAIEHARYDDKTLDQSDALRRAGELVREASELVRYAAEVENEA